MPCSEVGGPPPGSAPIFLGAGPHDLQGWQEQPADHWNQLNSAARDERRIAPTPDRKTEALRVILAGWGWPLELLEAESLRGAQAPSWPPKPCRKLS